MLRPSPRQQLISDVVWWPVGFVAVTRAVGRSATLRQVSLDFGRMAQAIPDHLIHVRQRYGGVLLNDLLWCSPFPKCREYRVEGDACSAHSHDAIRILYERNRLCRHFGHVFRLPPRYIKVRTRDFTSTSARQAGVSLAPWHQRRWKLSTTEHARTAAGACSTVPRR